jgi:hypothetical protein
MLIDCDSCAARGPACADCVVTVLLGAPPARRFSDGSLDSGSDPGVDAGLEAGIDLDGREQAAIAVLAAAGAGPRAVSQTRPFARTWSRGGRAGGPGRR